MPSLAYLVNATLLICHEIDSAHWREWELFHIPGGPVVFVVLHLPLVALVLHGMMLTARGDPSWRWYSLLTALAGVCGGVLHISLLLTGSQPFSTYFSVSLIAAFLLASIFQLIVTVSWWGRCEVSCAADAEYTEHPEENQAE
jgi:hypothetical protein